MSQSHSRAIMAEALFASSLRESDMPSTTQVRLAVRVSLDRYGPSGCAGRVAYEYGEHPMEAVRRMTWAIAILDPEIAVA